MYAASKKFTKYYKEILADFGLTYSQYIVLLALYEQDGLAVKELGEKLELDSGTLTPLLKRLETAGWLERQRSIKDERIMHVYLTEEAQEKEHEIAQVINECVSTVLYDEDEYKMLVSLSKKLNELLTNKLK
ncbi:MAG: MarR family transcriptional regulator [Kurthia sp.]|nr:MarR family transcriptional regulator [Candidatus Kurthia equi]